MNKQIITLLLLAFSINILAFELTPFTSDGCSAFPDGTSQQKELWMACCVEHDKSYWLGGTYHDRLHADYRLQECVAKVGEPEVAVIMLAGVRVGGSPFFPTKFRWGYGWPYGRGYKELTREEKEFAKNMGNEE